jgi:hypothetical protein
MSDEQAQIDKLRKALEALTEAVNRGRSANVEQTAEILKMVNILMARVDAATSGKVLPGTDRGATRTGQDDKGT